MEPDGVARREVCPPLDALVRKRPASFLAFQKRKPDAPLARALTRRVEAATFAVVE
jgi:hypothetical protein